MSKNMFNEYKKPVRPDAIPAQQLTDRRPRGGQLKKDALAYVNSKFIVGGVKTNGA
jgi:hypothetical protein